MKLKYYLRGIGIGVIVATLVMTVSSVIHNNNLSDEMIIKEAQKLGMIMPESDDDKDSLWGNDSETESSEASDVDVPNTESTDVETPDAENPSTETSDTETPNTETLDTEMTTPEDTQTAEDTQTIEDTQSTEDSQAQENENVATITIKKGDAARQVSEKLYAAGLVDNAEEFHKYLSDTGYAYYIYIGTYEIPKGSTFEEICDIIVNK